MDFKVLIIKMLVKINDVTRLKMIYDFLCKIVNGLE